MRRALVLAACALAASGCGSSWVRSGDDRAHAPPATADVGAAVVTAPPASVGAPSAAAPAGSGGEAPIPGTPAATPAPPGPTAPLPGEPFNQTVTAHRQSGLRLTFVVGDRLEFGSEEPVHLELTVHNTASVRRWIDSNSEVHFALWQHGQTDPAWTDRSCFVGRDFEDNQTSGIALATGEEVGFAHEYPDGGYQTQADRPDCRVPPGTYLAVGQVAWCPDDALVPFTYEGQTSHTCDQSKTVTLVSRPLQITIR